MKHTIRDCAAKKRTTFWQIFVGRSETSGRFHRFDEDALLQNMIRKENMFTHKMTVKVGGLGKDVLKTQRLYRKARSNEKQRAKKRIVESPWLEKGRDGSRVEDRIHLRSSWWEARLGWRGCYSRFRGSSYCYPRFPIILELNRIDRHRIRGIRQ